MKKKVQRETDEGKKIRLKCEKAGHGKGGKGRKMSKMEVKKKEVEGG